MKEYSVDEIVKDIESAGFKVKNIEGETPKENDRYLNIYRLLERKQGWIRSWNMKMDLVCSLQIGRPGYPIFGYWEIIYRPMDKTDTDSIKGKLQSKYNSEIKSVDRVDEDAEMIFGVRQYS